MNRRLGYIEQNYRFMRRFFDATNAFNESLDRLRRGVRRKSSGRTFQHRLHPELELVVSHRARAYARRRGSTVSQQDVDAAARWAARHLKKRRGRPLDRNLKFHLTAVIAVLQEFSGKPVMAENEPEGLYGPRFTSVTGNCVPIIFERIDPEVTLTTLVGHAIEIRKEWAGRPLRFLDLMPFYKATPDPSGVPELSHGYRLEHFETSAPIYSP